MRVLAISGYAQHGKDTIAKMIADELSLRGEKVITTHYADLLKFICKNYFGWNGEKDEFGRHILQYVGTDVIRKQSPDYWVDFVISIIKFFGDNWDWVIIPDTRFPNEIDRLKQEGYDVYHLRVLRQNFVSSLTKEQMNHPSETALDYIAPDSYILNNGTIDDLGNNIRMWIEENANGK